jgi:hypothetical protein
MAPMMKWHYARICSFGFLLLFWLSCGGFHRVEKLEKITPPEDLEEKIAIEAMENAKKQAAPQRQKKSGKTTSAFLRPEAVERAKAYANVKSFREGEKTTLAFSWFSIKGGEVTLEVHPYVYINGRKTYHFIGRVKSSATMDLIHSIDDWIESNVDVDTFYPIKTALHGIETDRLREGRTFFDYVNGKIHYWMKRVHVKKGVKEERRVDDFKPGVIDIFASAFLLRTQKLEVGKTYYSDVYNEGKRLSVEAQVLRREKLDTAIGEFDTLVVRPIARFEGILKTSGDSTIWLTDDERHFILRLETKIKIGYLVGEVKKIEDPEYQLPKP